MSGREHEVLGGLACSDGGEERSGLERTDGRLQALSRPRWSATSLRRVAGPPGGYAIQGLGSTLVEAIEGSVSNVIGLPVGLLVELAPGAVRGRCL